MKPLQACCVVVPLLTVAVILAGCSKSEQAPPAPPAAPPVVSQPAAVPTPPPAPAMAPQPATPVPADPYAKVMAAFQSSDDSTKSSVNDAVAAMKAGKYSDAVIQLQKLLVDVKLTPEQQQSLKDLLAQAQKQMVTGAADKAVSDAQKAVPEVPKALPLGQ